MNRLDTLISRETLPRTKTMQEHDDNRDTPTPVGDTTNGLEWKVWARRMAVVTIVAASIGLMVCTGLLIQAIQAYMTQQSTFSLVKPSIFNSGFELLGYSSLILLLGAFLALIIASNLSVFLGENKRYSYISASIGTILMFFSFALSLVSRKPGQEWFEYFSMVTIGIGLIAITFYKLVAIERNFFSRSLKFISYILLFMGCILSLLKIS